MDEIGRSWRERTSFLDHTHLGCTQRACKPNETFLRNTEKFESRIFLLEQLKKCQCERTGLTTWKDMLKKFVAKYCELANNRTEQCTKSRLFA